MGYRIITAANGEEAMEKYLAQKDEIHLIALDLGMPGMGGYRCLEEILKIDPGAKVIIASGYNDLEKKDELLQAGASAFLGKPYRYREIVKMVRNVLDESAQGPGPGRR
jgi:DNA-binding NtrC family response regulator